MQSPKYYPLSHEVVVYEAPMLVGTQPMIARIPLHSLGAFPITAAMTLYVPPARPRFVDPTMAHIFGMQRS